MEGPTGLWWGAILTITLGEASRGTPLNDIASSLSVGIAISAMVTIFIGISGLGTPSGSPVYADGNGFFHAAFGRAANLNIF